MSATADARPHILTVLGSTRQGRFGETVAGSFRSSRAGVT
jgi:hypothetical protein